MLEVLK